MTLSQTVAFSRNSANIFFHILTRCTLKCRHCYINPREHGRESLSLRSIKTWLTAFSDNSQKKNLIFLGGEPTLHPDLAAAIGFAHHLDFDAGVISQELQRAGLMDYRTAFDKEARRGVCTMDPAGCEQ